MTDTESRYVDDPAQDARVAALLSAATAPVEPGPLPGEDAALAAFGADHHRSGRPHMRSSLVSFKAGLAAAVGAGVLLTGGAAAAATGSLPAGAQTTAQSVLGSLGINVPGPNSQNANDHAGQQQGQSADHVPTPTTDETATSQGEDQTTDDQSSTDPTDSQGQGSEISKLATTTTLTGVDKGAAISTQASGGKSQAGADHSQAGTDESQTGADHSQAGDHQPSGDQSATGEQHQPQVTSQDSDASATGQGTAADASGGRSTTGTGTGSDASGSQRP